MRKKLGSFLCLIGCLWILLGMSVCAKEIHADDKMKVELDANKLSIRLPQVPSDIISVQVPIWTQTNGQDDLVWYAAARNEQGEWFLTIDLKNHGYASDAYNIHVYGYKADGQLKLLCGTQLPVTLTTSGNIIFFNEDVNYGKFSAKISNISAPFEIKNIQVAVWSEVNGQDDLIWYTAGLKNNEWTIQVDALNHKKSTGKYLVHVYYEAVDGRFVFVGGTHTQVKMNALGNVILDSSFVNESAELVIDIKNYAGDGALLVPVWSETDGQDDLIWYPAQRKDTFNQQVLVPIKDHGYDNGKYIFHVYEKLADGTLKIVKGSYAIVSYEYKEPDLVVEELDAKSGRYRIKVKKSGLEKKTTLVYFPVWSEVNGQDDIRWYTAVESGEFWIADISAQGHHYDKGQYNIHCYSVVNGALKFSGATDQAIYAEQISDGGLRGAVAATSWIIYDKNNGCAVYACNPDGIVQLASQTKLMTAMLVLENVANLDAPVTMTGTANNGLTWDTTKAGLIVGKQYTVRTLLEGLLVYSGGDCANLLAQYVAGSVPAFVEMMNAKALELGMSSTAFSDPVGLLNNYSTPSEYMKLAEWADNNAVLREIVAMPKCVIRDVQGTYARTLSNSNQLVTGQVPHDASAYYVDGMKTGFTDQAGYCLTATGYDSRYRYIVAVFHSTSYRQRAVDCKTLLDSVLIY